MKKLLLILLLIPSVLFSAQLNIPSTGTGDVSNGVMSTSNFMLEVAKGNVPGHSVINKFGHNPDSQEGDVEDVWGGGGLYGFYPATEQFIDIESSSVEDDILTAGAIAGTGAHTVILQGLCEDSTDWVQCETEVEMNGIAPVEVDTKFIRLFRAFVRTSGDNATNEGNITAYIRGAETLTNTGIWISATHGQTQQAIYTVPSGKTAYFVKGYVGLSTSTVTQKQGTFNWMLRVNAFGPGGAWLTQGEVGLTNLGSNYWKYEYGIPAGPIPFKTDIRITLTESNDDFDTVAGYDLILVDDGY
jgi:hypothetical protein